MAHSFYEVIRAKELFIFFKEKYLGKFRHAIWL